MNKQSWMVMIVTGVMALGMSGCAFWQTQEVEQNASGPVDPLDSFEEVGEPNRTYTGDGRNDPDQLSSDIERLQDARREYNQERSRTTTENQRSQQDCLQSPDARKVPIEDGSAEPGVYCQQ